MYCPKCGSMLDPGANFCVVCGAPVESVSGREGFLDQYTYDQSAYDRGSDPRHVPNRRRSQSVGTYVLLAVILVVLIVPVADILVDWLYNCGTPGIRIPQRLLGVTPDGIVGPETLKAVNGADQAELFAAIKSERIKYYSDLVARKPEKRKFFRGWMNRLLAYRFEI